MPESDARWLATELKSTIWAELPNEYAVAARRIEHAVEDTPDQPFAFEPAERDAVLHVLEAHLKKAWLPEPLVHLANAMHGEIAHERDPWHGRESA